MTHVERLWTPANRAAGDSDRRGSALTAVYWRRFAGTASQVRAARQFATGVLGGYPGADDVIVCLSELATNAVVHSASGNQGGAFRVGIEVSDSVAVVLRVCDQGGQWQHSDDDHERLHGLGIVRSLALGLCVAGDEASGRIVIAWFGWVPCS